MNKRGRVKAVSIVSVFGMVIALLAFPSFAGFVGAAGRDDCDRAGAIAIDVKLLNPKVRSSRRAVSIDLSQPIIAGTYSVTLVSFDDHSDNSGGRQPEEQWFAQLLDADGRVVYQSGPTRDLPDSQDFLTDTFRQQTVTGTATRLRAVHRGAGDSINSIVALCALFTPEPPPKPPARIVVKKVTTPAGSSQDFIFNPSYGPDFTLKDGQQHDSGPLDPGTYKVAETVPDGWDLTSATCDDGSAPDAIDLQENEVVTCTFTNAEPPPPKIVDLELTKTVDDPLVTIGETVTFTIAVSNKGPDDATGVEVTDALPAGLSYRSHKGDGSFDQATGVWVIGDLAFGGSVELELVVKTDKVGVFANVAEVSKADQSDSNSTPGDGVGDDRDDAAVTVVRASAPRPPERPTGVIGDLVWFDVNRNEVVDSGEAGVSGATVTLISIDTGAVTTDVTDGAGSYRFSRLALGSYTVSIDETTIPENTVLTTPRMFFTRLTEGERFLTADFGIDAAQVTVQLDVDADRDDVFADRESVPEGESTPIFRVTIESEMDVTLRGLTGDVFGDLAGRGTCPSDGSERIAAGATTSCEFTETISGNGNETQTYEVTATFSGGTDITDAATVSFTDVLPSLKVTKEIVPGRTRPGEEVEFTATITNTSPASTDPVKLDRLVDNPYGDVTEAGGSILSSDCNLVTIPSGGTYTCTFSIEAIGEVGESVPDTLTAEGQDDEGNPAISDDVLAFLVIRPFDGPDLKFAFTDEDATAPLGQGETFSYVLYAVNRGDQQADEITVIITLPEELTPVSPLPPTCNEEPSSDPPTIKCSGLSVEAESEILTLLELEMVVAAEVDKTIIAIAEATHEGTTWSGGEPTMLQLEGSGGDSQAGSIALLALLAILVLGLAVTVGVVARRRGSVPDDGAKHGL